MKDVERTGSHPIVPGLRARHGRLNAELRLLAFHGLLWVVAGAMGLAWTTALLAPEQFARLPLWPMGLALLTGALTNLLLLFLSFPSLRWKRAGTLANLPSPWPLVVFSPLSWPFALLAILRDRFAATGNPFSREADIERTFAALVRLPRRAALALGFSYLVAGAAAAAVAVPAAPIPGVDVIFWALLATAAMGPFVALSFSRTHAMLRPELLSAPRDSTQRFERRHDLRWRLVLPATIIIFGALIGPLSGGTLWLRSQGRSAALGEAERVAGTLVNQVKRRDAEALGLFLSQHPEVSVRRGNSSYGPVLASMPKASGSLDFEADGLLDAFALVRGDEVAVVPLHHDESDWPLFLVVGALFALGLGVAAAFSVAQGVRLDVLRATRQVNKVARGRVPDPMHRAAFHTRELQQLVRSVDGLVARISEANVAKYVVIEKAQEADRLRSQFLANMSHDLRSPLNSVLGFSELMLNGVDGELTEDQAGMCQEIQTSGRFLLQQIDDILDTAKIDAGRMEVHREPMPPATLVSRSIKLARNRLHENVLVEAELAAGLPPAYADPYRAVQALENVLVFAGERVTEGNLLVRVSAKDSDTGRYIHIEVYTPVRPAAQEELAEVRAGFHRIPGHNGLGLALPIAGSIAELHGGDLDIDEPDERMRFTLRLPVPERRRRLRLDESQNSSAEP